MYGELTVLLWNKYSQLASKGQNWVLLVLLGTFMGHMLLTDTLHVTSHKWDHKEEQSSMNLQKGE